MPSGSIQNPRIGRNPSTPPMHRATPRIVRCSRVPGTLMRKRPNRIVGLWASALVISSVDELVVATQFDIAMTFGTR